ncbi:methenyltetrahydromethanopterin cyclohydrolase [Calidifontimicrobium sp. SYSU G02091]|uniref:methenyltetrahydromethanopterin cyclohydrolase n=1 Tax=Calidifontimicrobium sp. SYSU G02091 TaxID=2926421 RepID=UPI001F53DEBA|nr:methenyltetrahydromethanopterin cyclohydrolase [Calidifontimicrobium sp. SYSU G02091]MCI1192563.1 methenyltetrahydromethanopterin cyclohydrolase [Calidifontimicrobium sp. SYSU G02091]
MTVETPAPHARPPSVNRLAAPLLARLRDDAARLRVAVTRDERGVTLIDAGIAAPGGVEAGLLAAEICMGGLGEVRLVADGRHGWSDWLHVRSSQPVLACLASQYAGWSLSASKEETGGKKFFALGSGPARALAAKEELFAELGYRDDADHGVIVLEVDRPPPPVVVDKLLRDCRLAPEALAIVLTPTTSLAGTTQVVARVLEVALHRAHELKFPLEHIVDGSACAPLPAPCADGVQAMGRTNDAILYGGQVRLTVSGDADAARELARRLPSSTSRDYGRSFADLFAAAGYDFYQLDGALFAPAEVWVSHLESGRTWHAGHTNLDLLHRLWREDA